MIRHPARISSGHIVPDSPASFSRDLSRYDGRRVWVTLTQYRAQMTTPQLRYWWSVPVAILAEHCGYDRDDMHAAIKYKFLRYIDEFGLERVPSIRDLDTAAMSKLIDDVIRWAITDLGVYIPAPNEAPIDDAAPWPQMEMQLI